MASYVDQAGKDRQVFRAGDTFARHGTTSEPWDDGDVRHLREEIRRQERAAALTVLQDIFAAAQAAGERAQHAAAAPASALTWRLDRETLTAGIVEQLRAGDEIPLTLLIKGAPRDASASAVDGHRDDFEQLLDALACVVAQLIVIERPQLAERAIGSLASIYNATFTQDGQLRCDLLITGPEIHLAVAGRVLALGALAIREQAWPLVRALSMQPVRGHDADYWQNWLFHGKVSAARAGLLRDDSRPHTGRSPIVVAHEHILRLGCLRPDIDGADETFITSICQFDILAAFKAFGGEAGKRSGSFMPNFGEWFASRTDPAIVELIKGGEARAALFPHGDDELAAAVRAVGAGAARMSNWLNGWSRFEAQPILTLLAEHPE